MWRIIRRTVASLALLVTVAAVALAVYVGDDDTVFLRKHAVGQSQTDLIVTDPELVAYRNLSLIVRADNPRGVFVGAASQVDVDDYSRGAALFRLEHISRGGVLSGRAVDGARPAVRPEEAEFWTAKASGSGQQELRLRIDAVPQAIVIAPRTVGSLTIVQVGIRISGLFWLIVGTAVGAGLLLVVCLWLERRHRRQRPPSSRRARAVEPRRRAEPPRRRAKKGRHAALTSIALLVLTGCAELPERVEVTGPATKPGVEHTSVDNLVSDYGRRTDEVHQQIAQPKASTKVLTEVNRGPALAADEFASAYARAAKVKPTAPPPAKGASAYAPRFGRYPMWGFVTANADERRTLSVFTKDGVLGDWVRESQVVVDPKTLPEPLPEGRDAAAEEEDVQRASEVFADLGAFWQTGKSPADLNLGEYGAVPRQVVVPAKKAAKFVAKSQVLVAPFSSAAADLRVVRVKGGLLAMNSVRMTVRRTVKKGGELQYAGPSAQIYGKKVQKKVLDEPFVVTAAVFVPDEGEPLVLGTYTSNILRPPAQ